MTTHNKDSITHDDRRGMMMTAHNKDNIIRDDRRGTIMTTHNKDGIIHDDRRGNDDDNTIKTASYRMTEGA